MTVSAETISSVTAVGRLALPVMDTQNTGDRSGTAEICALVVTVTATTDPEPAPPNPTSPGSVVDSVIPSSSRSH